MTNFKVHYLKQQDCQNPSYILFIIHGYGDSGGGILQAFDGFIEDFDKFLLIAPDAPNAHGYSNGYEWFNLEEAYADRSQVETVFAKGVNDVIYLQQFIESEAKKYNLPFNKVFLAGFSQGAFIVNHLALTSTIPFAGIISLSGGVSLKGLEMAKINPVNNLNEFCIIHGAKDIVVQPSVSQHSADFLTKNKIKNTLHILPNIDHTINRQIMDIVTNFVTQKISK